MVAKKWVTQNRSCLHRAVLWLCPRLQNRLDVVIRLNALLGRAQHRGVFLNWCSGYKQRTKLVSKRQLARKLQVGSLQPQWSFGGVSTNQHSRTVQSGICYGETNPQRLSEICVNTYFITVLAICKLSSCANSLAAKLSVEEKWQQKEFTK